MDYFGPDEDGTLDIPVAEVFLPLLEPCRYKGAKGGRGSGKSHFFVDNIVDLACRSDIRVVCIREIQKSLDQSVKQLIQDKMTRFDIETSRMRALKTHIEIGQNGRIIFQGMQNHTASSVKSLENYHIAFIEEAHSLSQHSWDMLYPTLRSSGAEIWAAWNPTAPSDPVDRFFTEMMAEGDPDVIMIEANYDDNPWFPDVLNNDMERDKRRQPDKYAHIWGGKYRRQSEAQVFKNWTVEPFDAPEDVVFYYGADWGFSVDPSVLIRCFFDGDKLHIDYEAYKVGCEIDHLAGLFCGTDPAGRWENPHKHKGIPGAAKWPIRADSARPETISFLKRQGLSISGAVKGARSVEEGVEFVQNYDIVVHPRCVHTIDELSFYSYKVDKITDQVLPILEDKDNHVIDSLRYAVESLRRAMNGPRIT